MATQPIRIGIGTDLHRLGPNRALRLGGVEIGHELGLVGHSDADVLLHAITDALLGAAALGDIGRMFPNTEAANRGRDSAEMLAAAHKAVEDAGWSLVNLDCVVTAQRPKLEPYRERIRRRISENTNNRNRTHWFQGQNRRRRRARRPRGSDCGRMRRIIGEKMIRVYNTLSKNERTVRARPAGKGRHLSLRPHGL